jgi:prepilin-type N-terminal cleavage/methylation domain-containing protein
MIPRRDPPPGFTVIELTLALALISVLAVVVLAGRGMLNAARHQSTVDLIRSMREGARQWAMERCNGLGYQCGSGAARRSVSLAGLSGFPESGPSSPWDDTAAELQAVNVPAECDGAVLTCFRIDVSVPDSIRCGDLVTAISPSPEARWSGVLSANCTERTGWLRIVSR